ncbi:MAG: AAA family ATPase [Fimbriimonadales bacterium]|nr:AAA family ATPase [Fimbriimonadales bacterium]MDW8051136.1 AAA family ATPase [Armatimonadota bacterium]
MSEFERELNLLIKARYPLIYLQTAEETRAEEILRHIAQQRHKRVYVWTYTRGYEPPIPAPTETASTRPLAPELEAITHLLRLQDEALVILKDFHPFLGDQRVIRLLRDLYPRLHRSWRTVVFLSPVLKLPPELEKQITVLEMPLPTREEIAQKIHEILLVLKASHPEVRTDLSPAELDELVSAAQGLTMDEIENVCARSVVEHKALVVDAILSEKKQIVRKSGVLEYYDASETMDDVGGLDLLKEWLRKRRAAFTQEARAFGLPAPKGVLLLGVQGTGKSLSAKAIANLWGLPMLRLDVGRVFGSLVGASEANMRTAIRVAEAIAPCILWIDELEKGFAGVQSSAMSDSGTTARVFATFLTWMQEKRAPVFVVATANDVSQLPPELLRKGRFDEIFFLDLPTLAEREQIFAIHLRKRGRDPQQYDLKRLARATEGFSGAEIEQVVVAGLFTAFDAKRELTTEDMLEEIRHTVPLSVMMREEIEALRQWAQMRARPASSAALARAKRTK